MRALLLLALAGAAAAAKPAAFEVLHEWHTLDFDWPTPAARRAAVDADRFVAEYCMLSDVKAADGAVFVTVPRWRHGVPSTVNQVVTRGNRTLLRPYPSWEMNEPGDCANIQYAHVIEIDPLRRMWIVDTGRWGMFSRPNVSCPPKLIVWDMVAEREVRRHVFPEAVVDKTTALLRGVVVDASAPDPADWFAYVASTGNERLVVYSFREDASWFVEHESMKIDSSALGIQVGDSGSATFPTPIESLALAPRAAADQRLFFAAVSSYRFFSVRTAFIRNRTEVEAATPETLDAEIRLVGTRSSQSEGMTISDSGVMFYSVLSRNAINQWNISQPFSALNQVYQDDERLQWPDGFGWDGGYLYFTSNKMHRVATLSLDSSDELLFRLMRARLDVAGYMGPYEPGRRVSVAAAAARPAAALAALLCAAIAAAAR